MIENTNTEQTKAYKEIRRRGACLSKQQRATLVGQVKAGNPAAALKGLERLLQVKTNGNKLGQGS